MKTICIYAGTGHGNDDIYYSQVYLFVSKIFERNYSIIYGGGGLGLMGAISDCANEYNGKILGVVPKFMISKESSVIDKNNDVQTNSSTIVTSTMHERKEIMFSNSDAFIALPGGIGTLEEIIEIMTWAQIGIHSKPVCFFNINNFWKKLFELLNQMHETGFIRKGFEPDYFSSSCPQEILNYIDNYSIIGNRKHDSSEML